MVSVALIGAWFALIVLGCGPPQPAALGHRYENVAWSISVPDDLHLSSPTHDPVVIWVSKQVGLLNGEDTGLQLTTSDVPCGDTPVVRVAQTILDQMKITPNGTIETRHLGANDVALGSGRLGRFDATIGVICGRVRTITILALGFERPSLETVLATIVLRDPPGDPFHPPSSSPG